MKKILPIFRNQRIVKCINVVLILILGILLGLVISEFFIVEKPPPHIHIIRFEPLTNESISLYQEYNCFFVPYIFAPFEIPPSSRNSPILVGHLKGRGVVQAIAFHTDYYGVAVGYSIDGGEIIWINNGHCLRNWRAYSPNAASMPVFLLDYQNDHDLAIAVNTPLLFNKSFKLYFLNSDRRWIHHIDSLHLYVYGKDVIAGSGNQLNDVYKNKSKVAYSFCDSLTLTKVLVGANILIRDNQALEPFHSSKHQAL